MDSIQEFKQIAASLQPVKAALTSGASSQRGASGQALAAATSTKREIGDCYIWGSWLGDVEVRAWFVDGCAVAQEGQVRLTRGGQRTEAGARVGLPGSSSSCCHVWSVRRVEWIAQPHRGSVNPLKDPVGLQNPMCVCLSIHTCVLCVHLTPRSLGWTWQTAPCSAAGSRAW